MNSTFTSCFFSLTLVVVETIILVYYIFIYIFYYMFITDITEGGGVVLGYNILRFSGHQFS